MLTIMRLCFILMVVSFLTFSATGIAAEQTADEEQVATTNTDASTELSHEQELFVQSLLSRLTPEQQAEFAELQQLPHIEAFNKLLQQRISESTVSEEKSTLEKRETAQE